MTVIARRAPPLPPPLLKPRRAGRRPSARDMASADNPGLLFLLLATAAAAAAQDLAWWQSGVVYQIYPKSFKDSDGDGVGDLNGIIEKLDYLKNLGVAAIWLSPIYKSPMADNGYDIADFRAIDPMFGTMEDFDRLLAEAHAKGIKVILDFVPNHTSDEHEWFIAASDPNHENHTVYKDYYVWQKAKNGKEPNNWVNMFDGGSAWKWNNKLEMYYLHQFHEKQPDLNYRNETVLNAMKEEMMFWLEKGVDGFRMDAVMCLVEADGFPDSVPGQPTPMQHQNETYVVIQEFRKVMDEYPDTVMMTEAYGTVEQVVGYYGNAENPGAHFSFNFLLITDLNNGSTAADFASVIGNWIDVINTRKLWSNWVIGNHDQYRVASRYSPELVDGMNMLVTLLPGTAVTYNGEEIGMEDNYNMTCEVALDPQGCLDGKTLGKSRDPERTPFQWDNSANAGFSNSTNGTWLPVHDNYETLNAAAQELSDRSHLKTYRKLVRLRADPAVRTGDTMVNNSGSVLAFCRSVDENVTVVVVVNVGTEEVTVDLIDTLPVINEKEDQLVVYARSLESVREEGEVLGLRQLTLSGQEAVVLAVGEDDSGAATRPLSAAVLLLTVAAALWLRGDIA